MVVDVDVEELLLEFRPETKRMVRTSRRSGCEVPTG